MSKNVARLFEQFQPENYQLDLVLDRKTMSFAGTVTIRGKKTGRPSRRLTFHQKELKITSATIVKHDKKGDKTLEVSRVNNQNSLDEVRLHTAEMVYPGEYTVTMKFKGKITRPMNGIYPCAFKHDGKDKMLIATQFESHHAREAFPCVDEPEAKATFDLTLTTPVGETVIANTPVKNQKKTGKQLVSSFETTPKMSVYLLAFVYGEMGYKESKTKNGTVVRSYSTPGSVELTGYSVEIGVRGLEFFEEYFGIAYPLPKLDMVALPDFSVGAMENWGLMTFRESIMLVDEQSAGIESRQICALVVAHELSHQWFGNLVTMKWWDDLWLNESFANMMEYLSVNALYPEWHIWEQFISHETASAKRRDSLVDVQAVHAEVRHPDEINTIFDPSIVYAKGGSLLHMLMYYVGEAAFRKGLKAYFQKHKYGNTRAKDLWKALSDASDQNIATFMNGWLERPGYPLVDVDWKPGAKTLKLSQRRFLSDPTTKAQDTAPWHVPLASKQPLSKPVLAKDSAELSVGSNEEALLLNHDGQSYFLPRYTNKEHLERIAKGLKADKVDTIDRFLLLDNYILLQRGGIASTTELLDLLSSYEGELSETVWGALAMSLAEARKLVENDEASEQKLNKLIQRLVLALVEQLTWNDKPDDSAQTLRLRGLALSIAAGAKTQSVIDEGLRRFADFKKPSDLVASTRSIVYFCGARYGTTADFKKLLKLHDTAKNPDERDEIAASLTATAKPEHYNQLLEMLTGEVIRRQDLMHWYAWLLRNRYSRAAAWQWLLTNWNWVVKEFSSDKNYSYFARFAGSVFSTDQELKQFDKFFADKQSIVALSREITLAKQEITSRIAWRERNETAVKAWLKKLP